MELLPHAAASTLERATSGVCHVLFSWELDLAAVDAVKTRANPHVSTIPADSSHVDFTELQKGLREMMYTDVGLIYHTSSDGEKRINMAALIPSTRCPRRVC